MSEKLGVVRKTALSWPSVSGFLQHCINLFQKEGASAAGILSTALVMVEHALGKDFTAALNDLSQEVINVQQVIADIEAEWNPTPPTDGGS